MNSRELVALVQDIMIDGDDRLGKALLVKLGDDKAAECLIAMASEHLTRAIALFELVHGRKLAVEVMKSRLRDLEQPLQ